MKQNANLFTWSIVLFAKSNRSGTSPCSTTPCRVKKNSEYKSWCVIHRTEMKHTLLLVCRAFLFTYFPLIVMQYKTSQFVLVLQDYRTHKTSRKLSISSRKLTFYRFSFWGRSFRCFHFLFLIFIFSTKLLSDF